MEIADISVTKFITLEDTTIRAISRIITRECQVVRECGLPEVTDTLSRFRRDINAEVIKSSPQLKVEKHSEKHQMLARVKLDQKPQIKIVARPSSNSILRLSSSTAGPSLATNVPVRREPFSAKVVFFSISATDPKARSIEAAMYSTVASGANTTLVVGGKLLTILNGNKAALESQLNISIRSFREWKADGTSARLFPSPTDTSSSTPSGTILYPGFYSLLSAYLSICSQPVRLSLSGLHRACAQSLKVFFERPWLLSSVLFITSFLVWNFCLEVDLSWSTFFYYFSSFIVQAVDVTKFYTSALCESPFMTVSRFSWSGCVVFFLPLNLGFGSCAFSEKQRLRHFHVISNSHMTTRNRPHGRRAK